MTTCDSPQASASLLQRELPSLVVDFLLFTNDKVKLPGKNIEDYITIKDPELREKYHGREKIPIQVFHDACLDGKIQVNGDRLNILETRHDWAKMVFTPELFKYVLTQMLPEVIMHSKSQDEEQVRDHYDRGDDFYEWFLGPRMIYTSGIVLDLTIEDSLNLKPEDRLLDVGYGWGTLCTFAHKNYGCDVTGITLGKNQTRFGNNRIASNGGDPARAHDYRDIPGRSGACTKIVAASLRVTKSNKGPFVQFRDSQGSASVFQLTLHKNLNAYPRILGVPTHTSIHVHPDREILYVSSL
ncbi:S-adenosyl-L-methionine-dependent methyltransferase [Fomes fomentarius]|nr:S-adenosyl-L-methionine-dependent methyltransferase [Fomes fomentarius]